MNCLEWQFIPANARTGMCGPGVVLKGAVAPGMAFITFN